MKFLLKFPSSAKALTFCNNTVSRFCCFDKTIANSCTVIRIILIIRPSAKDVIASFEKFEKLINNPHYVYFPLHRL